MSVFHVLADFCRDILAGLEHCGGIALRRRTGRLEPVVAVEAFEDRVLLSGSQIGAQLTYDASSGQLPENSGWTFQDEMNPASTVSLANGVLTLDSSLANRAFWTVDLRSIGVTHGASIFMESTMKVVSESHIRSDRGAEILTVHNSDSMGFRSGIDVYAWENQVLVVSYDQFDNPIVDRVFLDTTDDFHTYRVELRGPVYELFVDGVSRTTGTSFQYPGLRSFAGKFGDGSQNSESVVERTIVTIGTLLEQDDVIGRNGNSGTVVVGVSDGNSFGTQSTGVIPPNVDWDDLITGDFNADAMTDLAGRSPSDGKWRVMLSTPTGFSAPQDWGGWSTNVTFSDPLVGDFNNDGHADIAGLASTGTWVVSLSNGTGFDTMSFGAWSTTAGFGNLQVGDFDADGRTDVAGLAANGRWVVGLSNGSHFNSSSFGIWSTTAGFHDIRVGDFDGDHRSDIAAVSAGGRWVVGTSNGSSFSFSSFAIWSTSAGFGNIQVGDFNSDGLSDIAGLAANGRWVVGLSDGSSFNLSSFAIWSTTAGFGHIQTGDYNGDGLTDIATLSNSGTWLVALSDGAKFNNTVFGHWSSTVPWDNVLSGNFA